MMMASLGRDHPGDPGLSSTIPKQQKPKPSEAKGLSMPEPKEESTTVLDEVESAASMPQVMTKSQNLHAPKKTPYPVYMQN